MSRKEFRDALLEAQAEIAPATAAMQQAKELWDSWADPRIDPHYPSNIWSGSSDLGLLIKALEDAQDHARTAERLIRAIERRCVC